MSSYLPEAINILNLSTDLADTGFGDCKKTISTFENKGLAGCHIEDQIAEKRCGHLDNKELITKEEMVKKIKESVGSRKDKNFFVSFPIFVK